MAIEWVTVPEVKRALGLTEYDTVDDAWLKVVVRGTNRFIDDTRAGGHCLPDDRTKWGATQLATRWYGRRNAQEVAAYAELGGPPPALDRDLEIALRLGRHYPPVVA